MKKIVVSMIIAVLVIVNQVQASEQLGINLKSFEILPDAVSANDESGDGAAHKGMIILQPDFNLGSHGAFGGWYWDGYSQSGFVPGFTFNVDFGVHDYVSVGPYVGLGGKNNYFEMAIGARGVFHWWQLMDDKVSKDLMSDKIDFYLPVHMGVFMDSWRDNNNNNNWHANFNGGGGLGFRYYFVKQFGMNLEWGWMEMSWAKIGLTVNLN